MDMLNLPDFDVPRVLKNKEVQIEVLNKWWDENLRHLKETGQYDKLRNNPARQPSIKPFVFR